MKIGKLRDAEQNAYNGISFDQEIQDTEWEAEYHRFLGVVFCYCGKWNEAQREFYEAFVLSKKLNDVQALGMTMLYRALRFLLIAREQVLSDQSSKDNRYVAQ